MKINLENNVTMLCADVRWKSQLLQ